MRNFFLVPATLAGLALLPALLHSQVQSTAPGSSYLASPAEAARPTPRLPNGKPDLTGPWDGCWKTGKAGCYGGGPNNDFEQDFEMKPGELDTLLQPWARDLRHSRKEKDEPYVACLPMGVPRINPYGSKFVQPASNTADIYILHENGDSGTHRQIYMDGRRHPDEKDLFHTWFGHSIGRWEGDTLVIDTIGYNDKFWIDGTGTPHTEKMHTVERYTRPNYGSLMLDLTLEDPGTFTKPIQHRFEFKAMRPGIDLMEFICLEDNEYGVAGGFVPGDESGEKAKARQQATPKKSPKK